MRLPATSCLQRGLASLRANWELVFAGWLQMVATLALTAAGVVPLLLLFGAGSWELPVRDSADWPSVLAERGGQWAAEWVAEALRRPGRLAAALGAMLVVWFAAFLVWCFFQGGLFGTLVAADRQAPQGAPRDWRWFRTFRVRDFAGWGRRYAWRYFWLINIFLVTYLLGVLVVLGLVMLAVWGADRWGSLAAVGIGCGGMVPLAFAFVVTLFWFNLASADAAREESGVWKAMSGTLHILGRRLGALALFFLILLAVGLASGAVFLPVSIGLDLVLRDQEAARIGGQAILTVFQWLWNGLVTVGFGATMVSLVRSETEGEPG